MHLQIHLHSEALSKELADNKKGTDLAVSFIETAIVIGFFFLAVSYSETAIVIVLGFFFYSFFALFRSEAEKLLFLF